MTFVLVALGGAAGSLARWGLGGWIHQATGPAFPWGTLAVNVIGCAAIGALAAWAPRLGVSEPWRIALQVGVLGGFTTFSSFGLETFRLASNGAPGRAAAYVVATNLACLAAVWLAVRGSGS